MPETEPVNAQAEAQIHIAQKRIIDALVARGAGSPMCPLCHQNTFNVGAFTRLIAQSNPTEPTFLGSAARGFPCVALVCQTCGSMQLVNLLGLGFTNEDLPSLAFPPELLGG